MSRVKPKKHLGQHFLKDENIALKIVNALKYKQNHILEIGPGTGILTKHLLQYDNFTAIDIDAESIEYLKTNYEDNSHNFHLNDFLKQKEINHNTSVIGNFPYNISSQIFFKIWDERNQVDEVVCMIQMEVADRIAAKEGSKTYGILSVLLQAFYTIEYLFKVPPSVFNPPPKVVSSVIRLQRNKVINLACDEALFKRVVKAGFGKRRKTLRNALKEIIGTLEGFDDVLLSLRAEQLTVNDFIYLTTKISSHARNGV